MEKTQPLVDVSLDSVAILADALMIFFLYRERLAYFRTYRTYFVAIYATFLAFPGADLIFIFFSLPPQFLLMRFATQSYVTAGAVIAAIWGYVATKLYLYPEPLSLRRVLADPYRPIFLSYLVYLIPMIFGISIAWGYPSAIITDSSAQVDYVLQGITLPSAILSPLLIAMGGSVVIAFTVYPFVVLTRLRTQIKDKEVRRALKAFTLSFSAIAIALLLAVALSSFGYSIRSLSNCVSVALLIVAVRAFRKPTFLKSFLGVVPSLESSPTASHIDQMILIYNQEDEKYGPISKYIAEGVSQRNQVIYFHQSDEELVREGLSHQGLDVRQHSLKGDLRLFHLGTLYQSRSTIDDTPLQYCRMLVSEARTLAKEGLRVIVDYDDFTVRPIQKFVEHIVDPRWTTPDHYLHLLMAFDSTVFKGEDNAFTRLKSTIRVLDLSESIDVFSRTIGLSHLELSGSKVLLEYDPQSDYERVLKSILAETASNFEKTVVFTRKDSPIYSLIQRQPGARIFILTSRVSYPKGDGENKYLLPAYDSSLLLDALNKTVEAYAGSPFTIMFDNITHYVFTLGQERTQSLIRQALEMMVSNKITAIFSINSKAHDQRTMSTFENMFDIEILCEPGTRVPEVRKKQVVTS